MNGWLWIAAGIAAAAALFLAYWLGYGNGAEDAELELRQQLAEDGRLPLWQRRRHDDKALTWIALAISAALAIVLAAGPGAFDEEPPSMSRPDATLVDPGLTARLNQGGGE